ncbi:MAG TPA: CobD/CbiB family cobalamin biosynthesis protein, partial [Steroidobacteraceae bacterium]
MIALLTVAGVLLDAALGEPRRWHPLVGFGRWARWLERSLSSAGSSVGRSADITGLPRVTSEVSPRKPSAVRTAGILAVGLGEPVAGRLSGVLAVLIAIVPWVLLIIALAWGARALSTAGPSLQAARYADYVVSIATLYFALGHQSLRDHVQRVHEALMRGDLAKAREKVGYIVSRDTGQMDVQAVASAAVESVLENGNDAVFGALFWFLIAGAPGVLFYRLANTLDAMWGYRTSQYLYFGWAAARLDDVLNFVPARLTALTYALIGHTRSALRCWRLQAGA